MYVNIVLPLARATAFVMDEALLSIRPAGHRQLVKSSLLLNIMVFLDQIMHAY